MSRRPRSKKRLQSPRGAARSSGVARARGSRTTRHGQRAGGAFRGHRRKRRTGRRGSTLAASGRLLGGWLAQLGQIAQRATGRPVRRAVARASRRLWTSIPDALQWPIGLGLVALALVATNLAVQVARKPTELYFPIEDSLHKTHAETWQAYGHLFRRHSTAALTPEFLAGLAQTEAAGNPVARTYWRFAWTGDPFSIYRPASSAVGMFQIIDGTFDEASRYCIHDHRVARAGPWHDWKTCWFNELYFRVIPSHAIELTAAHLQVHVDGALRRHPVRGASIGAKQELAALIHLCGAGAGRAHARRGLRLTPGLRCGSHDAYRYIAKVRMAQHRFEALSAAERRDR